MISQKGTYIPRTDVVREVVSYEWKDYKKNTKTCELVEYGLKYARVPRFSPFLSGQVVANRIIRNPAVESLALTGSLRPVQESIVETVLEKYYSPEMAQKGAAGLLLKLGTGYGKTYLSLALMVAVKARTLVVCHRKSIAMQWLECVANFTNAKGAAFPGSVQDHVVVVVINSLERLQDAEKFYGGFDMIIFDEVHKYCTYKKYISVLSVCQRTYMLGLSATPERADGSHKIAELCVGPIVTFDLQVSADFEVEISKVCYIAKSQTQKRNLYGNEEIDYPATLKAILDEPERLELVYDELCRINDGRCIYVFSDRRDYLEKLYKRLEPADDIVFLVGGMTKQDIENTKKNGRIIFATYQCACEGESIERMNAIILATPCKSQIEQTLGRILRKSDGTKRTVIDVVDTNTILASQWRVRSKFYRLRGYSII